MWWLNQFGRISGPYSDEQIRRGIAQYRFTKLYRISSDRKTWTRLDQTAFWRPAETADAEPVEPVEQPQESAQAIPPSPPPQPPRPSAVPVALPKLSWRVLARAAAVCCVIALLAVLTALLWRGGAERPAPAAHPATAASDDFGAVKTRVVLVHTEESSGTGFLVEMDGKKYVMSNDHVVRSASTPEMVLVDGTKLKLGAFSVARDRDLARFEVPEYDGDSFAFAETSPNNGDEIRVYGNSSGDDVITSLKGRITGVGSRLIKVDAEFVGGNSGSPILDSNGKVLAVAAYLVNGDNGKDWTTKDTQFDKVRRFGIRAMNVDWVNLDRRDYEKECARLSEMAVYWNYLWDYLVCQDASKELYKKLTLEHKDVFRKSFRGADGAGFHEMLTEVSKSYARQNNSWSRWQELKRDRSALIDELNKAIGKKELTLENGKKALSKFDEDRKTEETWENVKAKFRDFNAKRKEALLMARDFLTRTAWKCPLMEHGYSKEDIRDSADWYLDGIQYFLDQNAQKLKDLNKTLRTLEGKDDDDEE